MIVCKQWRGVRKPLGAVLALAMLFLLPGALMAKTSLLEDVIGLDLGMQGYTIGKKLTPEQEKIAQAHAEKDAHEGTLKFVDQDLHVVVDKDSGRVLALYKRRENADLPMLKTMVAELMDRFGAPTVMAHDKIIYWAFNRHGAVSEEDFARAKKVGQTAGLGIIATVKLNSEMEIAPDPVDSGSAAQKGKEAAPEQTGVIYFIITSDPLVKEFLAREQGE